MNDDRRKKLKEAVGLLGQARTKIEEARDEEQDALDNIPENQQEGEKGEKMAEVIETLDGIVTSLEEHETEIESVME